MASENIKDHKVLDLLDLSDSEVEEWIPDTDEEWAVTDEEDDPEPIHQERRIKPATVRIYKTSYPSLHICIAEQTRPKSKALTQSQKKYRLDIALALSTQQKGPSSPTSPSLGFKAGGDWGEMLHLRLQLN
ncbi:hypothetical protein PoB_001099200 [Plakobranchus ocellatus]|uniref:Uncharacterized protein n=1 Tax=Plakobranchus ocellatus TaxID=259542 RepID=A0AAV3YQQ8_9GAST|nr:hypothetical protein PoB_001099200 [Plakobranchus ocellatus]